MADGITTPGSYSVHTDEKSIGGSTRHVQRVTVAAGETLTVQIAAQTTTGAEVLAANNSRVSAQIQPRDGDIYLAGATADLGSDTTRRKVLSGESWETSTYLGAIAIKAVSGTVSVDVEEVS